MVAKSRKMLFFCFCCRTFAILFLLSSVTSPAAATRTSNFVFSQKTFFFSLQFAVSQSLFFSIFIHTFSFSFFLFLLSLFFFFFQLSQPLLFFLPPPSSPARKSCKISFCSVRFLTWPSSTPSFFGGCGRNSFISPLTLQKKREKRRKTNFFRLGRLSRRSISSSFPPSPSIPLTRSFF